LTEQVLASQFVVYLTCNPKKMVKNLISLATLPLVAAGAVLTGSIAQAADIGAVAPGSFANVYSISNLAGGGVTLKITGAPGSETASFDFFPPVAGGFGGYNVGFSTGAFAGFTGLTGSILDAGPLPFPIAPDTSIAVNIPHFLTLDGPAGGPAPAPGTGNDFFDVTELLSPTFSVISTGTLVEFGVRGNFRAADGRVLSGTGLLQATYVGLFGEAAIVAAARSANGITSTNSGTFDLTVNVPEPSTILGLAFVGASALVLRKRKA
jgi:PEP-CTERM motif